MAAPEQSFRAFTWKANGIAHRIITEVNVFEAFDPAQPPAPPPTAVSTLALWDTGATGSMVSTAVVASLGLIPTGKVKIRHAVGEDIRNTYLVNVGLPNRVGISGILASECHAAGGDFGFIVGMDIITSGDFALTNVGGKTWLSFRTPSCEVIDYVAEAQTKKFGGAGRNDPCPCGSGRKYKKCHGGPQPPSPATGPVAPAPPPTPQAKR
ncbi:MAG TPA: SEC-C metal-binding domain-containing protein [Thermoanaerobaculia bacterium]|nr:SEC-C metal-binding domain-containing protein [Thermoanaerobaculia bacterium]